MIEKRSHLVLALAVAGIFTALVAARVWRERPPASVPVFRPRNEPPRTPEGESETADPALRPKPSQTRPDRTPAAPAAPAAVRFQTAGSWKDRKNVIAAIPADQVAPEQEFLFAVAANRSETDAVRLEAVQKLEEHGSRIAVNAPLTSRIAEMVRFEPSAPVRYGLVACLGRLIAGHQSENEYLFDVFRTVLTSDTSPPIRKLAADRLGLFFESERALPVLKVALGAEPDQETRQGIERTIRQIEN